MVVATAGHHLLPELRERGYQYNAPVHIGRNCWIGAGAILVPGVRIEDNVITGAGRFCEPARIFRETARHFAACAFFAFVLLCIS